MTMVSNLISRVEKALKKVICMTLIVILKLKMNVVISQVFFFPFQKAMETRGPSLDWNLIK